MHCHCVQIENNKCFKNYFFNLFQVMILQEGGRIAANRSLQVSPTDGAPHLLMSNLEPRHTYFIQVNNLRPLFYLPCFFLFVMFEMFLLFFSKNDNPTYTLAGFEPTTHSSSALGGRRRRYH
jgi:hypothetical protein